MVSDARAAGVTSAAFSENAALAGMSTDRRPSTAEANVKGNQRRCAMKAKCVNNGGDALLPADVASGNTRRSQFHVTPDRDYTVYGLLFHSAVLSYLIEADTGFPQWTPASLFRVTDNRVPRSWVVTHRPPPDTYFVAITFPELAQSWELLDRLALGEDAARRVFRERQRAADLEFLDEAVERTARVLDGCWLQCTFCTEAWESNSSDAMVRCPKCKAVARNPLMSP